MTSSKDGPAKARKTKIPVSKPISNCSDAANAWRLANKLQTLGFRYAQPLQAWVRLGCARDWIPDNEGAFRVAFGLGGLIFMESHEQEDRAQKLDRRGVRFLGESEFQYWRTAKPGGHNGNKRLSDDEILAWHLQRAADELRHWAEKTEEDGTRILMAERLARALLVTYRTPEKSNGGTNG